MLKVNFPIGVIIALFILSAFVPPSNLSAQEKQLDPDAWTYSIRYVNAENLNVRSGPSTEADKIGTLDHLNKVFILFEDGKVKFNSWLQIVYPLKGYIHGSYLFTEYDVDTLFNNDILKRAEINKAIHEWGVIRKSFSNDSAAYKRAQGSDFCTILTFKDSKDFLIIGRNLGKEQDCVYQTYWTNEVDLDDNEYRAQAELHLKIYRNENCAKNAFARIYTRRADHADFNLFRETGMIEIPKTDSANLGSWTVRNLSQNDYNFKIELYDFDNFALTNIIQYRVPFLWQQKFEIEGPVVDFYQLSLLGVFAPGNFPIEKDFKHERFPFGANIEFGHTQWDYSIGLGFNIFRAGYKAPNDNKYVFDTQIFYLYGKYSIIKFFDNSLDCYVNAGLAYWMSQFQNVEYPSLSDYHPEYKKDGFNFLVGAGVMYNYENFLLGLQYQLYNTQVSSYGKKPAFTEFTNYYELYTGSHQVQLLLGYMFEF
ncbi:MAG: SH3 domain-containing protein [Bacteroidetes bacterium]|nr:SH3 domain-containing protein [Bacteroidota bacterium]MBU1681126.1 SH3 domain-containing protein [Bacteroidota bacterium]